MRFFYRLLAAILFIPGIGYSQQTDTLIKKLDSLSIKADSSGNGADNKIQQTAYNEATSLNVKTYFTLLGDDFKQQFNSPLHLSRRDWLKAGGFALVTGAVALANKPVNRFAVKLRNNNPAIASASSYITKFGGDYEVLAIAGFYAYGLIFHTQKEKTTTLLATQAYITAAVFSTIGKYLFAEQRPSYTDPLTNKSGPIFHGPFYAFKKSPGGKKLSSSDYSSFPSGHATAAFAAATVYAMEYRDKPLIPIFSYSAATLIGLSRLTENRHWPADIVVGAMLGYLSGRQVVNNYHRYSRIKQPGKPAPKTLSFNVQYLNRQVVPGVVYQF